jgi:hypothetical protein
MGERGDGTRRDWAKYENGRGGERESSEVRKPRVWQALFGAPPSLLPQPPPLPDAVRSLQAASRPPPPRSARQAPPRATFAAHGSGPASDAPSTEPSCLAGRISRFKNIRQAFGSYSPRRNLRFGAPIGDTRGAEGVTRHTAGSALRPLARPSANRFCEQPSRLASSCRHRVCARP